MGTPVRRRIDVMAQPHKKGFDEICKKNVGLSNDFLRFTVFENHSKIAFEFFLAFFTDFCPIKNVNVARFACNVE